MSFIRHDPKCSECSRLAPSNKKGSSEKQDKVSFSTAPAPRVSGLLPKVKMTRKHFEWIQDIKVARTVHLKTLRIKQTPELLQKETAVMG